VNSGKTVEWTVTVRTEVLVMDKDELKNAVHTLHKYFIWASQMRSHFYYDAIPKITENLPKDRFAPEFITAETYMSFWYAELYVVVEGWRELRLSDPTVDELLKSPNVDLLKRYRHGVFHFQKNYFDDRFMAFINKGKDSVSWVSDLHDAISSYFLVRFKK
jgi:hypothetical protein